MKPFLLVISALAVSIAFTACSTGTSDNGSSESTDTTLVTTPNAVDGNQEKLDANKKLVTDFYQSLFGDKDSTAIDKYVADDIKEHNPAIQQDGKEALKNALRPFLSNPNIEKTKIDIKQVAADGDLVWLFVRDVAPNKKVFARVDIFRVDNGKIVENWKISEAVSEKSENANSTF